MKQVSKVWGKEEIIANCEYCGKLLHIDKGAISSVHYHKKKKETFYCIEGLVKLTLNGENHLLIPNTEAITIMPEDRHSFEGLANNNILIEVSTHDEENETVRLSESSAGMEYKVKV